MSTQHRPWVRTWWGRTGRPSHPGFCHFTVCFSSQDFLLIFFSLQLLSLYLAWIFWYILAYLSSPPNSRFCKQPRAAPSTRQVPHPVYPLGPKKPPPPSPSDRHRYSNCSRNFRHCCAPGLPPPNPSMALCTTSTQVAPPPRSPAPSGWTRTR
jgi:hypothetical protein